MESGRVGVEANPSAGTEANAVELRQLEYFVAVARHLSFTRAAESLHLAQPSLSEQIRRLEESLGCKLFDRSRRRVQLTQEGKALLPHAQRILAQVRDAETEVRDYASLRRGRVALGALPTIVLHWLPGILADLRDRYPGLELQVTERGTDELLHALDRGELDLGIVTMPFDTRRFRAEPLLTERLLLITGIVTPLGRRLRQQGRRTGGFPVASLRDFAQEPFIQYEHGYGLRQVVAEACRGAGFTPRVTVESGRTETIKRFVARGLGVGIVPESVIERRDYRELQPVLLAEQPTRTLALVFRRGRYLSAGARVAADFIRAAFAR